ncbi:longevity assurance proteins LAG1/LAC1 [Wallemia mellicola]|nr:longevity assurance proteins LAG1/LAC1 [Wallemia mellicola]
MIVITVIAYFNWRIFTPGVFNPFEPLLLLSNPVPRHPEDPEGTVRYAKSYKDILFVLFYVVVFSFTRQFITIYLLRPLAYKLGVRKEAKVLRFLEQAYTFIYFSFSGAIGIWVMYQEPTWWYKTEHFWLGYPHWDMKPHIKLYYLLQTSYWLQQMLVLILGLEKPRKDFNELIMHHIVTLWLVLWSYLINLSMIGNAIFVTMDVSDIFLALAKCFNYVRPGHWVGNFIFGFFILVWSYMRHWLNLRILWSVWYEFDLIPSEARRWWTPDGVWMVDWMKYQIFLPILALQLLNLFWYFLIWRILIRALLYNHLADERSDDEEEEEENDKNK